MMIKRNGGEVSRTELPCEFGAVRPAVHTVDALDGRTLDFVRHGDGDFSFYLDFADDFPAGRQVVLSPEQAKAFLVAATELLNAEQQA